MDFASASFILSTALIILLIQVLSFWQIFVKAGYEGWKSIIPIYNTYILSKIGGQPTWVFVSLFIPFVNIVASIMISVGVAKAFGKGVGFAIFGLMLFSFFGYMYLGWGQSEYINLESENN
jgi:hypothetical protein